MNSTQMQINAEQSAEDTQIQVAPHSVDVEQQLLGALLTNNGLYDRVMNIIKPAHFYDPVHRDIYECIIERLDKNALANPITLKPFFEEHEGLKELGGAKYLVELAGNSVSSYAARDYAEMIYNFAIRRSLADLGRNMTDKAIQMREDTNPKDQIVEAEQQLYQLAEQGQKEQGFQSFLSAVTDAIKVANAAYERDGGLAGVSTGFMDIDRKLGGLHRSDLLILAGRPSMGKTSLATNIAFNIAKAYRKGITPSGEEGAVNGGVVGFFSLEMSAEQLAARILSEAARIPSNQIRRGDFNEDEFRRMVDAAKDLEGAPLYIDDTPALPIQQLAARARRLKRTHGLDALFVDYLQLMRGSGRNNDGNRVAEISEITVGLKAIAKELDIPVVALSQLSRQVENRDDKRPQLSDLRESGSIEQDADVVMFVYRAEYYEERSKPNESEEDKMVGWQDKMAKLHGKAEVIIGKQRHGPIGTVDLLFNGEFTRFESVGKEWQEKQYDRPEKDEDM